jgi:phosphoribosylformylglycinamidine synthase subunit PurSL
VARHRLTIRQHGPDPRAAELATAAHSLGLDLAARPTVADVVVVDGDLDAAALATLERFLVDDLLEVGTWDPPAQSQSAAEVALLPGVTDVAGATAVRAARELGVPVERATVARRVEFDPTDASLVREVVERAVANSVVERWGDDAAALAFEATDAPPPTTESIAIRARSPEELAVLGVERSLALDPAELHVIQEHFRDAGREPTDVELETLAQTWSEHCAHKTFRAVIELDDGSTTTPLLARLRACTDRIAAPFVRSAFVGNAGIVSWVPRESVAIKAETHNHPSAIEPFGGANTGVGGVVRDVLGVAHRPVAVTDVLCFGPPDLPVGRLPAGALHPRRIRDGVVAGVADYGNKLGLPTVAGAVLYDERYTTNPLVFAGCIGLGTDAPPLPGASAGDRVVVVGGRTGRDGLRGATFSSATMDAATGTVAGASVQIGDPVTEKLVIDAVLAVDGLYTDITDCGAGGLSSAVGEMADHVGADVELQAAPLKYAGLAPWEIWLSEAQERMVLAVPPSQLPELRRRCDRLGVEVSDLGAFTGDGRLVVRSAGTVVLDLDTGFLHEGRPQRHMRATRPTPDREPVGRHAADPTAALLALLAHLDIASKADIVHRYDHEVGGGTLVRPLVGAEGPADGVVLADPAARHGIAIGIGVNPAYGVLDPEWMAHAVVDEAIRNVVAVGADPDRVALLDNFSWGDPRRASTLGELVAAVAGCCDAAEAHASPFVSGKDSLNNEYVGSDGLRHSVPPTLVITAVAHVPDADGVVTPEPRAGDVVLLLGSTATEFGGSHLDLVLGEPDRPGSVPAPDPASPARYRRLHTSIRRGDIHACHDVSEGGLAVALAEMCITSGYGIRLDRLPHVDVTTALFAESTGRLLVTAAADRVPALLDEHGDDATVIGTVVIDPILDLAGHVVVTVAALREAFGVAG